MDSVLGTRRRELFHELFLFINNNKHNFEINLFNQLETKLFGLWIANEQSYKLCKHWRRSGYCPNRARCRFQHFTMVKYEEMCYFNNLNKCNRGKNCFYKHDIKENPFHFDHPFNNSQDLPQIPQSILKINNDWNMVFKNEMENNHNHTHLCHCNSSTMCNNSHKETLNKLNFINNSSCIESDTNYISIKEKLNNIKELKESELDLSTINIDNKNSVYNQKDLLNENILTNENKKLFENIENKENKSENTEENSEEIVDNMETSSITSTVSIPLLIEDKKGVETGTSASKVSSLNTYSIKEKLIDIKEYTESESESSSDYLDETSNTLDVESDPDSNNTINKSETSLALGIETSLLNESDEINKVGAMWTDKSLDLFQEKKFKIDDEKFRNYVKRIWPFLVENNAIMKSKFIQLEGNFFNFNIVYQGPSWDKDKNVPFLQDDNQDIKGFVTLVSEPFDLKSDKFVGLEDLGNDNFNIDFNSE